MGMQTPTLSVIIPTYNRRAHLERALRSVLAQTVSDYELWVVDDASTDDTVDWLTLHYPQVQLLQLPAHQGAAKARNCGVDVAQGELIAFLDSDDQWQPHYLATQLRSFQARPEISLSYTDYCACSDSQILNPHQSQKPLQKTVRLSLILDCFIHSLSQVVVRRVAYQQVGGLNPRLVVCHDQDLYLRLLSTGGFAHVPHPLVQKYWTQESLVTQSDCQVWLEDGLRLLDILFDQPENAVYLPLKAQARQRLRQKVAQSKPFFSKLLAANGPDQGAKQTLEIHAAKQYAYTDELWIITCYFNPCQYQSKLENYQRFQHSIQAANLNLLTVECAFREQPFELKGPNVITVRSEDALWQKERLLNIAIQQLPASAQKVAWLDCDILFVNPDWAKQTAALLDQHLIIQPFSRVIRLPAHVTHYSGTAESIEMGFAAVCQQNDGQIRRGGYQAHGHTGYAWAARREILEQHGLYDCAILGSADHFMAHAMYGDFRSPCLCHELPPKSLRGQHFATWGQSFFESVQARVGFVPGMLLHLWHGSQRARQYETRQALLNRHTFYPEQDIAHDDGPWRWASDKPEMHRAIWSYFGQRREDLATSLPSDRQGQT